MMNIISSSEYFPSANKIPENLYCLGNLQNINNKRITIVGTRRPTEYGKYCVKKIIGGLSGLPVSIVSGLAIGIDSLSHEEAIKNKLHTIAIPGSSLEEENIYPRSNLKLANKIIDNDGALISIWQNQKAATWTFPARNSIMAAIADIVIVIEAKINSGTLITANEAIKRNVTLCAIPGNIDSLYSSGPNYLISNGAKVITSAEDIINLLELKRDTTKQNDTISPILNEIKSENHTCDSLASKLSLPISEINIELTMLEISGNISIDNSGIIRAIN